MLKFQTGNHQKYTQMMKLSLRFKRWKSIFLKSSMVVYLQCESRVEQELGKSGSNAAKDMTKQARQGADQGGGLDVR